jgi:hypothetical protein
MTLIFSPEGTARYKNIEVFLSENVEVMNFEN